MEYPVVTVRRRDARGKGAARKLRALGYIPAVLYGQGFLSTPLVVDPKEVVGAFRGERGVNTVLKLRFADGDTAEECLALVREYAVHPVRRSLQHCDFLKVSEDTELTLEVPIRITGKSEGEKLGAKVSNPLARVRVRCGVRDIPAAIEVDVTPLGLGDGVMLSELTLPPGVRTTYTKDVPVVLVRMGRAEKEPGAAAEGAPAEGETPAAEGTTPAPAGKSS